MDKLTIEEVNQLDFPVVLRKELKRVGWTYKVVQEKTGLPWRTVQNWVLGKPCKSYQKLFILYYLRDRG